MNPLSIFDILNKARSKFFGNVSPYQKKFKGKTKFNPGAFGKSDWEFEKATYRRDVMGKPRSWKKARAEGLTWK